MPADSKEKDRLRKELGKRGEELACLELQKHGFEILERNWRASHKEIDIICADGKDIRFVEVKSRKEPVEADPLEAVDRLKQRRIGEAAKAYLRSDDLHKKGFRPEENHFDVITLVWDEKGENYCLEYVPDAYILIYA